jgi:hypothetical protein
VAQQHGGGGAGDAGHAVVLGQPVALEAQALAVPGQLHGVAEGLGGVAALHDGTEIENGKRHHAAMVPRGAGARPRAARRPVAGQGVRRAALTPA